MNKIAIVTGANRGIGKEIAKQLVDKGMQVIATGRNLEKVTETAHEIGGIITPYVLDVSDEKSCNQFQDYLEQNFPRVDVLVNNAGIIGNRPMTAFDMEQTESVLNTNFYGAMRVTKAIYPLLEKSEGARIINISSGMGALDSMTGGYAAYRLSKWALNGFTLLLAGELANSNIKVNAVCPGWCQTDMGGSGAPRPAAKGAETAIWLATESNVSTGDFYRDKKRISW